MKQKLLYMVLSAILLSGCAKSFLEVKSRHGDETPRTITHWQAIMDDAFRIMNRFNSRVLGMIAGDELYVEDHLLPTFNPFHQRNTYLWSTDDFWENEQSEDWNYGYRRILMANMTLEGIHKISPTPDEQAAWDNVKGTALFFRAQSYYELAQLFCPAYVVATADSELGLPLRTESDITERTRRSSVQETYHRILSDLEEAFGLLPENPVALTRPSVAALHGLKARVYLQMRNYEAALQAARACLQLRNALLDLNSFADPGDASELFATFEQLPSAHPEIFFYSTSGAVYIATFAYYYHASPSLIAGYPPEDLRTNMYFGQYNGHPYFRGSYTGGAKFNGMATDEMLLIQAECEARIGSVAEAIRLLNHLRSHRIATASYTALNTTDRGTATRWVLEERRRELVFRGTRWEDIRRLNAEGVYPVTLTREVDGDIFKLEPGDPRFVFPLPPNAIELGGYPQN